MCGIYKTMTISTNQKFTIYRYLYANAGPGVSDQTSTIHQTNVGLYIITWKTVAQYHINSCLLSKKYQEQHQVGGGSRGRGGGSGVPDPPFFGDEIA